MRYSYRISKGSVTLLVLLLLSAAVLGQRPRRPDKAVFGTPSAIVDELVQNASSGTTTKAMVVAIVEKGRLVYSKGYGDAGSGAPDMNTVFYIGSLSKAVTGFGLMQLVDQGKVSLQKEVGTYVPDLPAAWAKIPLLNYTTHTSGIPGVPVKADSFQKAVDRAADKPMFFEAGAQQLQLRHCRAGY